VGDGESINVTAAADRRRRRSTPGLGDGTGNAFVRSTLALSTATLRAREARESKAVIVLEGLAGVQPGPVPTSVLCIGTFVVTFAWAREAAFGVPGSRNLLDGQEGGHSTDRRELHIENE
jgi:hypothetical protein